MKVRVVVRLKPEVSDPEGFAIREALGTLDCGAVRSVRVGKIFDLELDETDETRARADIEKVARDVLSNPVIEDYALEILTAAQDSP